MTQAAYYEGKGKIRSQDAPALPLIETQALTKPEGYRASRELAAAVDVALMLGMPLLLTGEPGSGKSQLAHSIAWELGLGDVLSFTAKSDMQGTDLFYHFDTVGRFHAAQTKDADADARRFITFNALGKAILKALPKNEIENMLGVASEGLHDKQEGSRSVVLIDEIDKAPRDVPNDILTEIDEMAFKIPEISTSGEMTPVFKLTDKQNKFRPIIIITSNSEKGLPDPFLRRCVYHHIKFPAYERDQQTAVDQVTVSDIVASRLGERYQTGSNQIVKEIIELFKHIRQQGTDYIPSVAELLNLLVRLIPETENGASKLVDINQTYLYDAIKATLFKNQNSQQVSDSLINEFFVDN